MVLRCVLQLHIIALWPEVHQRLLVVWLFLAHSAIDAPSAGLMTAGGEHDALLVGCVVRVNELGEGAGAQSVGFFAPSL